MNADIMPQPGGHVKKKIEEEDPLSRLMKLTKKMKDEKVVVAPKGPPRGANKWRSQDPKFSPTMPKSSNLIVAGGMEVDPGLKNDYENWRLDKIAEQNERRLQKQRKFEADRKARAAQRAKDLNSI